MTKKHFRSLKKFTKKRRKYQKGGTCCDYEPVISVGCADRNNYEPTAFNRGANWFQAGTNGRIYVQYHVKKHIDLFYGNHRCLAADEALFKVDFRECVTQNEGNGQAFGPQNVLNIGPAGIRVDVNFILNSASAQPGPTILSRAFLAPGSGGRTELVQFIPLQKGQPFFGPPGPPNQPGSYGIYNFNPKEYIDILNQIVDINNFETVYDNMRVVRIFGTDAIRRTRYLVPQQGTPPDSRVKLAIFIFFNVLLRIHQDPTLAINHGWPVGMDRNYNFSQMTASYFSVVCNLSHDLIANILILMSKNRLGTVPYELNRYEELIRTFITDAVNYIIPVMVANNNYNPVTNPPWQNNADVIPPPAAPPVAAAAAPPIAAADPILQRIADAEEAGRHAAEADVAIVEARNAALPPLPVGLGAAGPTGLAGFDNHNAARQGEILTPEEVAQNQADYNTLIGLNVVPTNDFEEQKKEWRRLRRENQNPENPNQNPLDYITEFGGRTKRRKRRKNKSKKNKHKK